ncbi:hypothetical protein CP965_03885 [Halarcobacter mediterraneus]|uniref:Uncharacterized protein n=1 Tax=Halarcobacter mediterraneus TaxID=2023153 RepID=A0A4V1M1P5_9BACT|nr:hypothetical protein [Halarcobacter mediterraneus]RXK14596.1 hypothetical protein CP965_03885 [Halarcobacter mediterraneus]
MEGKILGVDKNENLYTIKAENAERYTFTKDEWKSEESPSVGQTVDFDISEDNKAIAVFNITKPVIEKTEDTTSKAIIALLITLFFGFIGTAVTRFAIMEDEREEEFGKLAPTIIHFITAILIIIPIVGWIIAIIANIYYAIQNYKACK